MTKIMMYVPVFGTYEYAEEVYLEVAKRTVAQLREVVFVRGPYLSRTKVRGLRKPHLVAMVAEWETADRELAEPPATPVIPEEQRQAARVAGRVAWGHLVAVVRSMGRQVRGTVVDTVLRTPDRHGGGRVLLVVQHDGRLTRTLHALTEVKFEPATS